MTERRLSTIAGLTLLAVTAAVALPATAQDPVADPAAVVTTYADIAEATYGDSLTTTRALHDAIDALVADPSEATLAAARDAWLAARVPYQQTEAYRFGNPIVDEWEGKVNAWPLDEGLIDYVAPVYGLESDVNQFYRLNIVASPNFTVGGREIDASVIDETLLADTLHEIGGVEANVASGFHAIEFLLWGQDLNGTGPGAGERPHTDFDVENCTGENCDRRVQYLQAAADLLVNDLEEMVANWQEGGAARAEVETDPMVGLRAIFMGIGSLAFGELAGERIQLGLLVHDPEEEHDCFSDNTHNSHFYNIMGIENVYFGRYERILTVRSLPGRVQPISVRAVDADLAQALEAAMAETRAAATTLKERAETIEAFDQMIGEGNEEGNAVVQTVVDRLVDQTSFVERAILALDLGAIELERSQALDDPEAIF